MRKLMVAVWLIGASLFASAQESGSSSKPPKKSTTFTSRAGDHFMFQLSYDSWLGAPDSIKSHMKGFQRGLNVAVMLNKPFKSNPKFSIAGGVGISSSNIFFKKMTVGIGSSTPTLPFTATDSISSYKKYKLSATYIEIPLEFRFSSNPSDQNKSVKAAIGFKIGTVLNVHTKGKTLKDANGNVIHNYTEKITTKGYFNSTRLAATARVGYGIFSLFGSYYLSPIYKTGVAADINLLQIGLCISGL